MIEKNPLYETLKNQMLLLSYIEKILLHPHILKRIKKNHFFQNKINKTIHSHNHSHFTDVKTK